MSMFEVVVDGVVGPLNEGVREDILRVVCVSGSV